MICPITSPNPTTLIGDLPILKKLTESYGLWHRYLPHLPQLSCYTLGAKIDNLFTDILELILLTKYADKHSKETLINKAISKLDCLKFFLQIS
jgi:hypothetical protein